MNLFDYLGYFNPYDFNSLALQLNVNKKRKGMNKHPHKNNYKRKLRGNKK